MLSTQENEFFWVNACNGNHWVLVLKIVSLTGNISMGVNGDIKIFSDYDEDPHGKTDNW